MRTDIDRLLAAAEEAHASGRLQEADQLCRQILGQDQKNLPATILLGVICAKVGNFGPGIQIMRGALNVDANSFEAHYWLGIMARSTGNLVEGLQHAKRAASLRPGDAQAHFSLALFYLAKKETESAIASLDTAIKLEPNVALLHHKLGDALRTVGRDIEAVEEYRRAVALAPDMPNGYVALGELLRHQGKREEAASFISRAFEVTPDNAQSWMQLAKALVEAAMHEEALKALTRVIELEPGMPVAHAMLGKVYQQLGRFDLATTNLEKVIALQTADTRTYLDLTSCKRITKEDQPFVERMTSRLQDRSLTIEGQCYLHYALAKANNDLGEYGKAMRHYDEANGIMQRQVAWRPFDRKLCKENIDQAIRTINSDYIARHKELSNESDLPILIVGMIRSGTTLIEQIISSHPDVAAGGEQNYLLKRWSRILQPAKGAPHAYEAKKIAKGYLELLHSIDPTKKHVTDKMPNNFLLLGMAHMLFPNARLLHCRRNPVDTCISIYTTFFQEPVNFAHDKETIVFFYREYLRLMEHWRKILPADRFLEVDYEDLVVDRERVTRQMIEFCGLKWDDACLHHETNDGAIRTPSWWQARQPVYKTSIGRWRNYEPYLGEFKDLF